jgi:hypothetical protein
MANTTTGRTPAAARATTGNGGHPHDMSQEEAMRALGEWIFKANPYTRRESRDGRRSHDEMQLCLDRVERDEQPANWYFKGGANRVVTSLRIPYCAKDEFGQLYMNYLLIGFEGGGAY